MRRKRQEISDALSPDFSICEHCGEPIGWDEICYTHLSSGFADCGVTIEGKKAVPGVFLNPEILKDPSRTTNAEPVEWYEEEKSLSSA